MSKCILASKFYLLVVVSMSFSLHVYAQDCPLGKLIIDQDFNHYSDTTLYTVGMANADFGTVRAYTSGEIRGLGTSWPQKTYVINGLLRAEYTANAASGRTGGFLFDREFEPVEKAMLEYKVKFDKNFTWAAGGKLPGLGGSIFSADGKIPSGCVSRTSENTKNGFSCRLMWRTNRAHTAAPKLVVYLYHPNRPKDCGEDIFIIKNIEKDQWYTIKQYVELNTPGQNNGILKMYVNGKLLVDRKDIQYRLAGKNNLKINDLIMNTYRGGSATDPVWWSPNTDYAYFDDIKVWTNCDGNTTNVKVVQEKEISVFPNPSQTGTFTLSEAVEWNVVDRNGRLIKSGNENRIDLANYGTGVYFLKSEHNVKKIVIVK